MKIKWPAHVRIVEVGPRDGLQNEPELIPTAVKLEFIQALVDAGLKHIEATSFVHPKAIPQLADAMELARQLPQAPGVVYSALVPNMVGMDRAVQAGIEHIAVFTAASETFTKKNINMTIAESLAAFKPVVAEARRRSMSVRGYASTCFVCPFEGNIRKEAAREVCERLVDLGVDEVAVSDTIGAASPKDVLETVGYIREVIPCETIALHFHDTYGTALANVVAGLELGITTYDASAGGLGGCPYAPGATGNLATEDLVYLLNRMGIETGVNLEGVIRAAEVISKHSGRPLASRQAQRQKAREFEAARTAHNV